MATPADRAQRLVLAERILAGLDPALVGPVRARFEAKLAAPPPLSVSGRRLALVGHRAAGKTTLLPAFAELTGRAGIDLDAELAARWGRPLSEWVRTDPSSFRRAEREAYGSLPSEALVACGGGFLSLHADLLGHDVAVLIPVSEETYRTRLLADRTRPRLRPELSLEEELSRVYREREALHRAASTVDVADFLAWAVGPA